MRFFCHNCGQAVTAAEKRADGAVRCPRCLALTHLPGRSASGAPREMNVGLGWPGYVVVAVVVALTAVGFLGFRGHAQQWLLSRVLPEPPTDAVRLVDFYCTHTLPAPGNSKAMTLDEGKEKSGLAYLVVELSLDSATAEVRQLTDSELQEVKRGNPRFSMAEAWASLPANDWFKIVGPEHPLRSACAHQESGGVFAVAPAWNSPLTPSKPERIKVSICFEAKQKLAESGALSFQFKWKRPLPLRKSRVSSTREKIAPGQSA